jgi:hypothetical protein
MMKNFKFGVLAIFIIGVVINVSWAADDGWKKTGESDGIVGYSRPTNKSSVDEIKAEGIVNAPIAVVLPRCRNICFCAKKLPLSIPRI